MLIYPVWKRIVRFIAEDGQEYCGEPSDAELDVGLAMAENKSVLVKVLAGNSPLDLNTAFTGEEKTAKKILSPLTPSEVGTIRCVGLNYTDHAAEMKLTLPKHPEIFFKPNTCVHGPQEPLLIPHEAAGQADPEVELAVVIGKDCKNVSPGKALNYVLGYMTANDVTARIVQTRGSQWGYSKGFDQFAPMGPTLVSAERIPDPAVLCLKTTLDGKVMQDKPAKNMIFSVAEIVSYLSVGTTLKAGTVILTGTPSGIGHSYDPPIYLKDGSVLRVWISHGLGTLVNPIVQEGPVTLE
ncbi:Fumarylacetoacetate hydrolase domain-containing protein 2-like protein [Lachnellula suecica]|uniref:Fumarylacetoacetate hydrolase domain-containing protein 2-like protein n=1 Tax=Lachnellula suecica TaxID=602035 RepID=A0A8T9C5X4_9HELO|nr:Fumarylacetoacetate hydrolase domain-containing protein 2-like protein [Lachnellula suecica]